MGCWDQSLFVHITLKIFLLSGSEINCAKIVLFLTVSVENESMTIRGFAFDVEIHGKFYVL